MMKFNNEPFVIAHRGASAYAPENTVAAFSQLAKLRSNWVEFDVFISKDQVPMVFHDDDLRRIAQQRGRICDYTALELQAMNAGSWFSEKYANETIPTLQTVLATLAPFIKGINVEVKSPGKKLVQPTIDAVIQLIEDQFPTLPIWYSSFDERCLQAFRNTKPEATIGWLTHRWRRSWPSIVDALQCQTIHINHAVLTPARTKALCQSYPVFAYTVNDRNRALELFDWGVQAVYSDYPDLLTRAASQ